MAEQTEAACLLETGALYFTRTLLRAPEGVPVFAGFKHGAFSLYFGDEPIYHFDLEGRWQRAFVKGIHYLKGLDGAVQAIDRVREGENLVLKRKTLSDGDAAHVDAFVRSTCVDLLQAVESGRLERVDPPEKARPLDAGALREFLRRAARWDAAAWAAQGDQYRTTYGPLPFLPPDIPTALVVQATLGTAFGAGRPAERSVRSAEGFTSHAQAVAALAGKRLSQYRALFLAGGDVLKQPVASVASYLETLARVFPIDPGASRRRAREGCDTPARFEGVHAFLDDPSAPRPSANDWPTLRALNLLRVTIGVESGDPATRALYGKSWRDDDLRSVVADARAAGLGVGLAVLAGAGGEEHAARHVAATVELLGGLDLGPGDLVSLLDANELRDPEAGTSPFTPLSPRGSADQLGELKEALLPLRTRTGAKVVVYSLEKQRLSAS